MWHLPVGSLFGVGKSTAKALNNMGFYTIGDVAAADRGLLVSKLGKMGDMAWNYANGIESVAIVRREAKENSYGNSVTTGENVASIDVALGIIMSLAESVALRLRTDGKKAGVVTVTLVDAEFNRHSHQCSLEYPTNTTDVIYENAQQLLYEMWKADRPVRLIGISAGKAAHEEFEQMSLFADERTDKLKKLDAAMDEIRNKFGEEAVVRARLLGSERQERLSKAKNAQKRRNDE